MRLVELTQADAYVRRFRYPARGRRLKEMGRPSPWVVFVYVAAAFARTVDKDPRVSDKARCGAADVLVDLENLVN